MKDLWCRLFHSKYHKEELSHTIWDGFQEHNTIIYYVCEKCKNKFSIYV